jgi:DNA-binding GntR family transcriptional regulator
MISSADLVRAIPTPIYQQLKRRLRQQIETGDWPPQFKLPAEVDLAQELGVSRGTVRHAIQELSADGLLVRVHGRGTYVTSTVLEQPLADSLVAFSEELAVRGIAFETRLISQELVSPTLRVAGLLATGWGQRVFALRRVRMVSRVPLIYLENYVAVPDRPGIEKIDFQKKGLFETLEDEFGLCLDLGQRSFQAQAASAAVACDLEIEPGAPVLYQEELVFLDTGRPVVLSDVWLRADRFRLSAMVKRFRGPRRPPGSIELT